jgi:hypothetical protein
MLAGDFYERTSGAAGQPLRGSYERRTPERTVLHELVSRYAQTMLAELRDADGLAFALLPAPTGADLLAILDRVIRQISRRLAREAAGANDTDEADLPPDLFAQVQAEAATTWRSPATTTANPVRGSDRLRAWCAGFSLHAGVVVPEHDREALERLCRVRMA